MPDDAFYLEAEILVDSSGTGDPRSEVVLQPEGTGIRWWYRDPEHYRHELYDPDAMLEWGPGWTVADGEDVTFYDPTLGTYERWSLAESGFFALYPGFSLLFGPIPTSTVHEFVEQWRGNVETIERVGTQDFLGRTVDVFEYGPIMSWASANAVGTSGSETEQTTGVGRFFIDAGAGFILRHEVDAGDGGEMYSAEVTLLDLNPEFGDKVFEADLPAGALEGRPPEGGCSSSTGASSGSGFSFATMPLRFSYIPEGWMFASSGTSQSSGCQVEKEWSAIQRGDAVIAVAQQSVPPTGVPEARRDATPVAIGGLEGYRLTVGEVERLVWAQDGVIITIETNAATFDELLRIAESAEGMP